MVSDPYWTLKFPQIDQVHKILFSSVNHAALDGNHWFAALDLQDV